MNNWIIRQQIDLSKGLIEPRVLPTALMMQGDKKAHEWRITVTQDGQPVTLAGTVRAYFQRADGNFVPVTGSFSGNVATVTLTSNCYEVPGALQCVMRLTDTAGDSTVTLGVLAATVELEPGGGVVDPEHIIPDLSLLLDQIERCEKASDDAEKATGTITGMVLTAETLEAGSSATVTSATDPGDGHLVLTLGLPRGNKGDAGKSAYESAVSGGYAGTEAQWLEYLRQGPKGSSAYEVAVASGYAGTQAEWLASLKGDDGASAYSVAVANGFTGTQAEWMASLKGDNGASAYTVAVASGFTGTQAEWLASLKGDDGASAYAVAVANGFTGTQAEWLESLKGVKTVDGETPDENGDVSLTTLRSEITHKMANVAMYTTPEGLFIPPTAPNTWVTDATGRVLNISTAQFLALFYDPLVGSHGGGYTVTKNDLGLDQSGTLHLYEYDFCPAHYSRTILLTSGQHPFELPASFGLAHLMVHMMTDPYMHSGLKYLRENVRIKVIPILNPWGFNQNPKTYGNVNGININRNFDSNGRWYAFPNQTDEYNQKGSSPFSEAETVILRDWALINQNADFWIDCHTGLNNGPYDNFLYYLSRDPAVPTIENALYLLEDRIRNTYGVSTPTREVRIDEAGSMRMWYAYEQAGISGMTLEFTAENTHWGTALNNEGADITEYEIALTAYVFSFLGLLGNRGFSSRIRRLERLMEKFALMNEFTIVRDDFARPDGELGKPEYYDYAWTNDMASAQSHFTITSGAAHETLTAASAICSIEANRYNVDVSVDIKWSSYAGIYVRYTSNANAILIRINSTGVVAYKYLGDASNYAAKLGEYLFTPTASTVYTLRVRIKDTQMWVFINGTLRITAAVTMDVVGTRVALRTSSDSTSTFDNLVVRGI